MRVVLLAPARHLQDDWQQIQSFWGRRIPKLSFVLRIDGLGDKPLSLKPGKPIGQDICRDSFFRVQKVLVVTLPPHDQIPEDQKAPPVADGFQRQ
jgi:hypothetical protein